MKLLIAEDEIRAREGLRLLIPPVFEDVRTAGNGQAALELAREMKPDVVLCDVRMPKMNGIELARRLRLLFPEVHILFISAYSDKEYLKSAISVQADGYLEKPVDEKELLYYLNRIASGVRKQNTAGREQDNLADLFARQQLLRALLGRADSREEALRISPALTESVLHAGCFLPVSIRIQWPENPVIVPYGLFPELKLAEMLNRISRANLFTSLSESHICVLFYGDSLPSVPDCRQLLMPVLNALRKANPQALNVCACIGEPCRSLDVLYAHYHAAHLRGRWLCFADTAPCAVDALPAAWPPLKDRSAEFERLLKDHQLEAAKDLLTSQTAEISRGVKEDTEQVRAYYELLLTVCVRVVSAGYAFGRNHRDSAEIFTAFSKLSTLPELCRFICVRIDDIAPSMNLAEDSTDLIREVQACVRQNLSDPSLSVQSVADMVGLSENYLSALFKRETGQTLHKVIVDLRIEQAKYLLLNHYRAADVAQRCGFSSNGYFHSVFKKYTGLSPAAFLAHSRAGSPAGREPGEEE